MPPSELLSTRKAINFWYFVFNLIGVTVVYCIPNSLIYQIKHHQFHLLLSMHIIHIISLITYYCVSWSNPGYVSYLSSSAHIDVSLMDLIQQKSYCHSCKFIRPLQSKHCKQCNRCIIKFDHHCGFLSNCIGYKNQKIYMFYVATQFIIVSFAFYVCLQSIILNIKPHDTAPEYVSMINLIQYTPLYIFYLVYKSLFQIIYQLLIGGDTTFSWICMAYVMFCIAMLIIVVLLCLLLLWHFYLILSNQTTYSIYIRYKYQSSNEKQVKIKSFLQRFISIYMTCCQTLPQNIKTYCCDALDDKYTQPVSATLLHGMNV